MIITNVAKCNLGKVNLKAMLSSWMQKACPAAPVTFRTIRDAYMQWLLYAAPQASGPPSSSQGHLVTATRSIVFTQVTFSAVCGRPKLGVAQALAGALGVPYTQVAGNYSWKA